MLNNTLIKQQNFMTHLWGIGLIGLIISLISMPSSSAEEAAAPSRVEIQRLQTCEKEENVKRSRATKHINHQIHLFSLGMVLECQGKLDEAIAIYREIISLESRFPWVPYHTLGRALTLRGNVEEAIATFHAQADLDPRDQSLSFSEKRAIAHFKVAEIYQNAKPKAAIAHFREAIALDPSYQDAYAGLSQTLVDQSQLEEAFSAYRQAMKLAPSRIVKAEREAKVYGYMGDAYAKQGQYDKAIASYRQAIELSKTPGFYSLQLGKIFARQNKIKAAQKVFHQAQSTTQPETAKALSFVQLGHVWVELNQDERAIKAYQTALKWLPTQHIELETLHQRLGQTFVRLNQMKPAIAAYRQAVEVSPHDQHSPDARKEALAHEAIAADLVMLGRLDEAMAVYLKAFQLYPNQARSLPTLIEALIQQERWEELIAFNQQILAIRPRSEVYAALGRIFVHMNQLEQARLAFLKAIEGTQTGRQPSRKAQSRAFTRVGDELIQLGDFASALESYRQAVRLMPQSRSALIGLGQLLWQQNLLKEAHQIFQKVIAADAQDGKASTTLMHNRLGLVLMQQGDVQAAIASFRTALDVGTDPQDVVHHEISQNLKEAEALSVWNRDLVKGTASLSPRQITLYRQQMNDEITSTLGLAGLNKVPMPPSVSPELAMYRRQWANRDPQTAPYLGHWIFRDIFTPFFEVDIFPSKVKGQVCMISYRFDHVPTHNIPPGEQVPPNLAPEFSLLKIRGNQGIGTTYRVAAPLLITENNPLTNQSIEFLGMVTPQTGTAQPSLQIYAADSTPQLNAALPINVQQKFERHQCQQ